VKRQILKKIIHTPANIIIGEQQQHAWAALKINAPFLFQEKATAAEYRAGLELAIAHVLLEPVQESETYTRMTQAVRDLSA
jgi:hypothetical protein